MHLKDRVAIITGAAGNLGTAVGNLFLEHGARVALVDQDAKSLEETYPDLGDQHRLFGNVDLLDEEAVKSLVGDIHGHFGRIDILVNIVGGFGGGQSIAEQSVDSWRKLFELNVTTAFLMTRGVLLHMTGVGYGRIVNISSEHAAKGPARFEAYAAAKAAVLRMTEGVAQEVKDHGVTVNAVMPTTLDTSINREAMPKADPGRWAKPEDVAQVIAFLASEHSRVINGVGIPLLGRS